MQAFPFWEAAFLAALALVFVGALITMLCLILSKRAKKVEVPEVWQKAADEMEAAQPSPVIPAEAEMKIIETEETLTHCNAPRKFLDVMAELGFKNPLEDYVRLTQENRVRWELVANPPEGQTIFEAGNMLDEISFKCWRSTGGVTVNYFFAFIDGKKRFADALYMYIEPPGMWDRPVKACFDWLEEKFQSKTPS